MIESKIKALVAQGHLTEAQAQALRSFTTNEDSHYPALGERVRLIEDPEEALSLLKSKRHSLLEISRAQKNPEQFFFVLKLRAEGATPTKRFGQPRTWLLLGVALGAALSSMVQMLWPKTPPPKAAPSSPILIYPSSSPTP